MKLFCLLLLSTMIFTPGTAQSIQGSWSGILKFPGGQLTFVLHLTRTETGYSATADSPDQGAKGMKVDTVDFRNDTLFFSVAAVGASYRGKLHNDTIKGIFTQGGYPMTLDFAKKNPTTARNRPQEPVKPYPYHSEEVKFRNDKAGIMLAGTFTLPATTGAFPTVILIAGSGRNNRDEEILGHKPFLVLADHLTRQGIAVLRFDKRGVAGSQGEFSNATSADFASDAEAAFNYLMTRKETDKKKIGLIGHSEGGVIAPMVAQSNRQVSFIVLLAAPGVAGDDLMIKQNYDIRRSLGVGTQQLEEASSMNRAIYNIIKAEKDSNMLKAKIISFADEKIVPELIAQNVAESERNIYKQKHVSDMCSPWFTWFIRHNPGPVLEKVKCPVLALNGEKDLQVSAVENLSAIKKSLNAGGNRNVTVKQLPGLNHLFQECNICTTPEYGRLEQTFSPTALKEISDWIKTSIIASPVR